MEAWQRSTLFDLVMQFGTPTCLPAARWTVEFLVLLMLPCGVSIRESENRNRIRCLFHLQDSTWIFKRGLYLLKMDLFLFFLSSCFLLLLDSSCWYITYSDQDTIKFWPSMCARHLYGVGNQNSKVRTYLSWSLTGSVALRWERREEALLRVHLFDASSFQTIFFPFCSDQHITVWVSLRIIWPMTMLSVRCYLSQCRFSFMLGFCCAVTGGWWRSCPRTHLRCWEGDAGLRLETNRVHVTLVDERFRTSQAQEAQWLHVANKVSWAVRWTVPRTVVER